MYIPNRQQIDEWKAPSFREAGRQVYDAFDKVNEWAYDNNKGIRTFVGTGMVLGGILGMASAGMVVEPQRARDLGIALSAMVGVAGLSFLLSAVGDYKFGSNAERVRRAN